ncbi:hypothetical protein ACFPH6_04420 [Streptomyces xiangluensis]|uniref:Uncharacterized protein n=1 Tax=Streptomyces xiangluensis TaxID=2665720 RepID=A0ABV8YHL1_9ACTN
MPSTEKIGNVSVQRYEQIMEKLRDAVEKLSNQHPSPPHSAMTRTFAAIRGSRTVGRLLVVPAVAAVELNKVAA